MTEVRVISYKKNYEELAKLKPDERTTVRYFNVCNFMESMTGWPTSRSCGSRAVGKFIDHQCRKYGLKQKFNWRTNRFELTKV